MSPATLRSIDDHAAPRELERVRLLSVVEGFPVGSEGTIVHVYDAGAFEVEFVHPTHGVVTVERDQVARLP